MVRSGIPIKILHSNKILNPCFLLLSPRVLSLPTISMITEKNRSLKKIKMSKSLNLSLWMLPPIGLGNFLMMRTSMMNIGLNPFSSRGLLPKRLRKGLRFREIYPIKPSKHRFPRTYQRKKAKKANILLQDNLDLSLKPSGQRVSKINSQKTSRKSTSR